MLLYLIGGYIIGKESKPPIHQLLQGKSNNGGNIVLQKCTIRMKCMHEKDREKAHDTETCTDDFEVQLETLEIPMFIKNMLILSEKTLRGCFRVWVDGKR